ncbi:MAG: hypothetical protein ACKOZV_10415 [Bacteroidota bacterium]
MENTLISDVKHILVRDLNAMAGEVADTPDEYLWEALPGVINPVGTLALHICGNLRHFIGAVTYHKSHIIIYHISYDIYHISCITYHISYIINHIS